MSECAVVHESSGNVFADLGLPDAEARYAKAMISRRIAGIIEAHALTATQAAQLLGAMPPEVSAVVRGQLAGFSVDQLSRFLAALGRLDA